MLEVSMLQRAVMHLYVRSIDAASFYGVSIGLWNVTDNVVVFGFVFYYETMFLNLK
jgi:hypothetical protein